MTITKVTCTKMENGKYLATAIISQDDVVLAHSEATHKTGSGAQKKALRLAKSAL